MKTSKQLKEVVQKSTINIITKSKIIELVDKMSEEQSERVLKIIKGKTDSELKEAFSLMLNFKEK